MKRILRTNAPIDFLKQKARPIGDYGEIKDITGCLLENFNLTELIKRTDSNDLINNFDNNEENLERFLEYLSRKPDIPIDVFSYEIELNSDSATLDRNALEELTKIYNIGKN